MIRLFVILTLAAVTSGAVIAQSTTTASPSPTPATPRPMLDQFGLSTGVFANSGKTASTENERPVAKVEYVNQSTFDTIRALIEISEFVEVEMLYLMRNNIDISPASTFAKDLQRNMVVIVNFSEECSGRSGWEDIKSGELTRLLQQNERIASEIVTVLNAGPAEYARFSKELNGVSEKYGVPLLDSQSAGMRLDKPALLKAMMAKINANYARVKKQMAVSK